MPDYSLHCYFCDGPMAGIMSYDVRVACVECGGTSLSAPFEDRQKAVKDYIEESRPQRVPLTPAEREARQKAHNNRAASWRPPCY